MVLLCGASAVSAASDNTVDNLTSDMDDSFLVSNNLNAVGVDESASVAQENDGGLLGQSHDIIKSDNNNSRIIYVGHHNTTDGGNGSFDNPFTTFKAVCDDVHGENNISIHVFDGTYYLGEGFTINKSTPLIFDTNNLNVVGINGSVIIKNYFIPFLYIIIRFQ